ncbi:MAG: TetR/AcrR family transcriptional regulator [Pseudomonadales bacterium]|nr:TetR/AcrR family transcriptional regulator [Pseudomonadales bacterium]
MSEKKQEILAKAIVIIQQQGYAALTMRHLAKCCDLKLASLQYHFKTRDLLIEAIAEYILATYTTSWDTNNTEFESVSIHAVIDFIIEDMAQEETAKLWPQLWAMGLVEPKMKSMLDTMYAPYIDFFVTKLTKLGCEHPLEEALALVSTLEGLMLFVGHGQKHETRRAAVKEVLLGNLTLKFGECISN